MPSLKLSHQAIILFFKWPVAGQVKTRLIPCLGEKKAADLYEAFIKDTITKLGDLEDVDIIGFAGNQRPKNSCADLHAFFAQHRLPVLEQEGRDLGARMKHAMNDVFQKGYTSVVLIGTDSPDLPATVIRKAFEVLQYEPGSCCIGPSEDGGYYLIGMNAMFAEAFENVGYSQSNTYLQTIKALTKSQCNIYTLKRWYDIDDAGDLKTLLKNKDALVCPHTSKQLDRIPIAFCSESH